MICKDNQLWMAFKNSHFLRDNHSFFVNIGCWASCKMFSQILYCKGFCYFYTKVKAIKTIES